MGFWACWCGAFSVFFGFGAHKHRHRRITVCCSVEYSQNPGVSQDITNSKMFISMFRVINTHILFTKSGVPGVPQIKRILSRSLITLWWYTICIRSANDQIQNNFPGNYVPSNRVHTTPSYILYMQWDTCFHLIAKRWLTYVCSPGWLLREMIFFPVVEKSPLHVAS